MRKFKYKNNQRLYYSILFFLIISSIAACNALFPFLHLSWWINILEAIILISMFKFAINNKEPLFSTYFIILALSFSSHLFISEIPINRNFWEVMRWITILYLLCIAKEQNNSSLYRIAIIFFIFECGIAIYERITLSRLINYASLMFESTVMYGEQNDSFFRSCSLLGHPLDNANIVSLFMGFILVNKRMGKCLQAILILLGLGALWAFNSRGAILIWIILLSFRFIFYNQRIIYIVSAAFILYLISPFIIDWLNSGALGRFTLDFSDDSSLTRIDAFMYFLMQDWNLEMILAGGKLIRMPGSDLLLENGVLLNLGYWGLIVGPLKIIIEIWVSYKILSHYNIQEKIIILGSFWGVGLLNNNTFNSIVITFFLFAYIAFYSKDFSYQSNQKQISRIKA